jgi:excisionase family DNA binding protein
MRSRGSRSERPKTLMPKPPPLISKPEPFLTPEEVAEVYRVPVGRIWRLLRQRRLPARVVGRQYRLRLSECEMFLTQRVEEED